MQVVTWVIWYNFHAGVWMTANTQRPTARWELRGAELLFRFVLITKKNWSALMEKNVAEYHQLILPTLRALA